VFKLYNITEIIAEQILEQIVTNKIVDGHDISGFCFCPRCWTDALALALNNLPPRYVVSKEGEVFARTKLEMDYQIQANISTEIMKAMLQVKTNPHHG